jgi:hypothetical protein
VVATTAARHAAVEQVLLAVESGVKRGVEHLAHQVRVFAAARHGRKVDLEHARIRRHRETIEQGRGRRRVTLQLNGNAGALARPVDERDEFEEVLGPGHRR